jgi:hypothetical protein
MVLSAAASFVGPDRRQILVDVMAGLTFEPRHLKNTIIGLRKKVSLAGLRGTSDYIDQPVALHRAIKAGSFLPLRMLSPTMA